MCHEVVFHEVERRVERALEEAGKAFLRAALENLLPPPARKEKPSTAVVREARKVLR